MLTVPESSFTNGVFSFSFVDTEYSETIDWKLVLTIGGLALVAIIVLVMLPIYLYFCIKTSQKRKQALAQLEDPEANRNTEL